MKRRLVLGAAVILLSMSPACESEKPYPVRFICESNGGTECPPGSECPELPLGLDTRGDLPGLFGHPSTPVTKGRPVGCTVGLSYGNPYYSDTQQSCTCRATHSSVARWECPI